MIDITEKQKPPLNQIIGSDEDRIAAILVLFRSLSKRGKWILSTKIELSPELYPNIPPGIGQDPEQPEDNG